MNQSLLQQPLPLGEYHLGSDIDHLGSANHNSFAGASPDPLLRDGSLAHPAAGSYSLPPSNEARYLPHRTAAANGSYSCPPTQAFSASPGDSGSASFSTSPSSASSSIAFPTFSAPQSGLTGTNSYSTYPQIYSSNPLNYPPPSHLMYNVRSRMQSISDHTPSGMLPSTRSPGSNMPATPPGATSRDNHPSAPHLGRHALSPRGHPEPLAHNSYSAQRHAFPTAPNTMSLSPSSVASYPGSAALHPSSFTGSGESRTPPFPNLHILHNISADGTEVTPDIHAKIEKGFFLSSDGTWTCYRRNYFSVNCSYTLNPPTPNRPLYVNRGSKNGAEQIQALAMSLSAAVDNEKGKTIDLLQQTPKRDKGPQLQIQIQKIAPTPHSKPLHAATGMLPDPAQLHSSYNAFGYSHTHPQPLDSPYLPLQSEPDESLQPSSPASAYSSPTPKAAAHVGYHSSASNAPINSAQQSVPLSPTSPSSQSHTFERIQFKSATANNGKRRAAQQYYKLVVELWADVRDMSRSNSKPEWVKVAQRISAPVVVRGRSPSHYQEQGGGSTGTGPGGSGGSSGSRGLGGPGGGNTTAGASMGGFSKGWSSMTGLAGGSNSGLNFRSVPPFSYEASPTTSHSVSSASSLEGGAVGESSSMAGAQSHGDTHMQGTLDSDIESYPGYRYYPSTLYEGKVDLAFGSEEKNAGIKDEFGHGMHMKTGPGRFHGVEGSKGWYPDFYAMSG